MEINKKTEDPCNRVQKCKTGAATAKDAGQKSQAEELREIGLQEAEGELQCFTDEMLFQIHGLDVTFPVSCDFCPEKFSDWDNFDAHMATHSECRQFACQLCNNTYVSWSNLVAHRKARHHGEVLSCETCSERRFHPNLGSVNFPVGLSPVGCEECGEGFNTLMQLYQHYRTHFSHQFIPHKSKLSKIGVQDGEEGDESFACVCPICFSVFSTPKQLAVHMARLSKDSLCYTCNDCHAKFCTEEILKDHNCSYVSSHTCSICGKVLRNAASMQRHCLLHVNSYSCDKCPKTFSRKSRLEHHKNSHALQSNFHCVKCKYEFATWRDMQEHVEEKHTDPDELLECHVCVQSPAKTEFLVHYKSCLKSKESEEPTNVTCPVCHKVFSQPSTMSRHLKLHNPGNNPHVCEICGETVQRRYRILEHARKHYGDDLPESYKKLASARVPVLASKSFMCEYCGREFTKKLNLQLHVRRHTGERPYSCQLCGKAFYTNQQLAIHVRQHTGERPYACGICSKTFTGPTALYVHRKLHDKVKRHKCPHCGKMFFWRSAFIGHVRLHTGERPYRCSICYKTFTLKGKLNLHMKKHAPKNAVLTCSDCGENFATEEELTAHRNEQCCVTMVTFVEEGPSGEKESRIIVMNTEDLERNNIHIDDSEVVKVVV